MITEMTQKRIALDQRTLKSFLDDNEGKHPSWRYAEVRAHCRKHNKHRAIFGCQYCGYNIHVECAHVKALSQWEETATLLEVNAESNILILCPNHHWEFDNNKLSLESIQNARPLRQDSNL